MRSLRFVAQNTYGYFHQIYMPGKRTVVGFERACQEGVHLHIFDTHDKTHNITNILFNYCQTFRAQFTCKTSEEQEAECDELLVNATRELPIT